MIAVSALGPGRSVWSVSSVQHAEHALARPATTDHLLTVESAAEALAVSAAHVRRLARRGLLPSVRIGKCCRIPAAALARVLREGIPVRRAG
ncbi:MAG: hypothetical protein DMD87_29840 [Candidatus Rokuibacteriota bacterium]|nr:MAG: hypothetical protein DMD87_29840 [Candidatus Rokubacteria bacterium]